MPTTLDSWTRASLLLAASDPANQEVREAFAECYAGLIRGWCRRRGLQEADQDDVAQTILCRLFDWLPTFQYDPNKRFTGLLRTMIHHAIVDLHRKQNRPGGRGSGNTGVLGQLHEVPDLDDASVEDLLWELTGQMERDRQLQAACQRIRERVAPHTWQAFWQVTVEGKPAEDVARSLGMARGTVLVAKHRVTKMIRSECERAAG